jgi:hypothetical protein
MSTTKTWHGFRVMINICGDMNDRLFINTDVKYGAGFEVSSLYEFQLMYFVAELGFTNSSYRLRRNLKLCIWKM